MALIVGVFIGWKLRGRYKPPPRYKRQRRVMDIAMNAWYTITPAHGFRLREIDGERLVALAYRINAGRPVTYKTMSGAHKLFSRTQWGRVRDELIAHGLMLRNRDGSLSPTPEGRIYFAKIGTPKRTHGGIKR